MTWDNSKRRDSFFSKSCQKFRLLGKSFIINPLLIRHGTVAKVLIFKAHTSDRIIYFFLIELNICFIIYFYGKYMTRMDDHYVYF